MDLVPNPDASSAVTGITALERKTSGFTVGTSDNGKAFLCNGTFTVTLDDVATLGNGFYFYLSNEGTGVITVDADGTEDFIHGTSYIATTTVALVEQGQGALFIAATGISATYDWYVIGEQPSYQYLISLTAETTPADNDLLFLGDVSATASRKMTRANFDKRSGFHCTKGGSNQANVNDSTWTKVTYDTEVFDVFGELNVSTGATGQGRFTPLYAGKYLVYCQNRIGSVADASYAQAAIYKNGSDVGSQQVYSGGANNDPTPQVTAIVDMNGSTDYLEHYAWHNHGSDRTIDGDVDRTFFFAMKLAT